MVLTVSSRTIEIDDPLFRILEEMTKVSVALKSWKTTVSEAFNDNRFFNLSISDGKRWQPITKALFDLDKTLFPELMGKQTQTNAITCLLTTRVRESYHDTTRHNLL